MTYYDPDLQEFAERLGDVEERFYGKYRGVVKDNQDPDGVGRLKVSVPALLGEETTDWALPCLPWGGAASVGAYWIPPVDATVWVEFEQGDISLPIWTGAYWSQGAPPADKPERRVFQTPFGHMLAFDDTEGKETVTLRHGAGETPSAVFDKDGGFILTDKEGACVVLDAKGKTLTVQDANGNVVTMESSGTKIEDANGHTITCEAAGVTIKATKIVLDAKSVQLGGSGGEPVLKGRSFLQHFMTHTHPTAYGPTGPPIPQGEASDLSTGVMTK